MKLQAFFIILLSLIAPRLEATAQAIVRGRVADAQTSEPLPGATIRVQNGKRGAVTDVHGEYTLRLPAGSYELVVTYIGYQKKTISLSVEAGSTRTLNLGMNPSDYEVDEVVVLGRIQGQQKALNQQKNSGQIVSVVAADQIGRFPDPNTAEAVQRIPGVTLQRDQGEGRFVIVRGLAPQFTTTNINGVQVPSPEADVRFVALDAIPANQLASIEVYKTLTPDLDGDNVGGYVNLVTRKATSSDWRLQGSVNGGYNNLMRTPQAQGQLMLGKRFGEQENLGVLVNGSYNFSDIGSDNWERDGAELELRDYALRRARLGLSSTIDYRFDERNGIYARGMYNSFTDREFRRTYLFVPDEDDSPFEDPEIERATKDRLEIQDIATVAFGGIHNFSRISFDYEVSYSRSLQDTPFDNEILFKAEPDALSTDFTTDPNFGQFSTDEEFDYLDNSNYEYDEAETGNTFTQDESWMGKLNISLPYSIGDYKGEVKFGGKYRSRTKFLEVTQNAFSWEGGDDLTLDQFEGGLLDEDFLDGQYELAANVDPDRFFEFFNANRGGFELSVEDKLADEAVESFTTREDVYAGYLMTDLQLGKLQVITGVRYEFTDVNYTFNTLFFDVEGDLSDIQPDSGATTYGFVLPSLNLRYALTPNTNLRAAVSTSYARPNFGAVVPSQEVEIGDGEGTVGNPELTPVSSLNLDLLGEHYFSNVGIISGGVFYKQLQNFIYTRRFRANSFNGVDFGRELELFQFQNGESATLLGAEVNYQQNLSFLPGVLSGLALYFNYTFTTSTADIENREGEGMETINLPGQAPHVLNASLAYQYKGFNARISYNYHAAYVNELGGDASEDVFIDARGQWDFNTYYTFWDNRLSVFAEFTNLTNAAFQQSVGEPGNFIQREFYSWWSRVGIKFQF